MLELEKPRLRWLRVYAAPSAILILALFLPLYRLDARTFHGDELTSLVEAARVGLNPNGILYFLLMHFWVVGGASEWWLRIPSVFFTIGAVAASYKLAQVILSKRAAILVGVLLATSAFVLEYSQEFRFYSFFLFAASIAYLAFAMCLRKNSVQSLLLLSLADLLVLGAHFFGLLVIASEIIAAFLLSSRLDAKSKFVIAALAVFGGMILLVSPVRSFAYGVMSRWTNPYGDPTLLGSRGISLSQFAKIPFTFFSFSLGDYVYPLTPWVFPAVLIVTVAIVLGIWTLTKLRERSRVASSLAAGLIIFPLLVYLVFDSLASPDLEGAAPRYLIFLLPLFYLVVAAGVEGKLSWLMVPLLLINLGSLASFWSGEWSYSDDLIDWRAVSHLVGSFMTPQTTLLVDGRAEEMTRYYFPSSWNTQVVSPLSTPNALKSIRDPRIILLSYNFHSDARAQMTSAIQQVGGEFDQTAAWSEYPLFVYVFDRKAGGAGTFRVETPSGRVIVPAEIYGLEFQDLQLPIQLAVNGQGVESDGAFRLPAADNRSARVLTLTEPVHARKIWFLSNVVGGDQKLGVTVANLSVIGDDVRTFPIRVGFETSTWDGRCQPSACTPAFTWQKRLALIGSEGYPGSWQEFDASIFAAEFDLYAPVAIRSLELQRVGSSGALYVWGIVLQP